MEIIGHGFLAANLAPLADSHPATVVVAAGVSAAPATSDAAFAREAALLYDLVRRCEARGEKLLFFSTASTGMYSRAAEECPETGPETGREIGAEDGPVYPATAYGRHKLAMEAVLAHSPIDHLILRLAHVLGPAQPPHQLLPAMVRQVCSGTVRLYRGARRDLIDVADVVTVVDRLLAAGVNRTVVNVASGTDTSIERIVDHIEAGLGVRACRKYVSHAVNQPVSVAKLHRLVPEVAAATSGTSYHRRLVDKYLSSYR